MKSYEVFPIDRWLAATDGFIQDLCNGAPAARFFKAIVDILEQAEGEMATPLLGANHLAQSGNETLPVCDENLVASTA